MQTQTKYSQSETTTCFGHRRLKVITGLGETLEDQILLVLHSQGSCDGDGLCDIDEADHNSQGEGFLHTANEGEEQVAGVWGQTAGNHANGVDAVGTSLTWLVQLEDVHNGDREDGYRDGAKGPEEKQAPAHRG